MNQNISPNQFALPGMEEHAHPGARHLPSGVMFHHETEKGTYDPAYYGFNRQGNKKMGPKTAHIERLYAHKMGGDFDPERHHANALGHMEWAGQHDQDTTYPGEIKYIERGHGTERRKGLMTDLYRIGTTMNVGQSTVPVHSHNRTPEGEAWSAKVGGPRPEAENTSWRPPAGLHPFEQHQAAAHDAMAQKLAERAPGPGQQALFNVRGGRGAPDRSVSVGDVIKNWTK